MSQGCKGRPNEGSRRTKLNGNTESTAECKTAKSLTVHLRHDGRVTPVTVLRQALEPLMGQVYAARQCLLNKQPRGKEQLQDRYGNDTGWRFNWHYHVL